MLEINNKWNNKWKNTYCALNCAYARRQVQMRAWHAIEVGYSRCAYYNSHECGRKCAFSLKKISLYRSDQEQGLVHISLGSVIAFTWLGYDRDCLDLVPYK